MKKNILISLLLIFIINVFSFAQGYYFNIGQNFTTYDYKNSLGQSNPNIKPDNGLFFDFGWQWKMSNDEKWQYKAGLTFQQFNAKGKNSIYDYSWKTNYLGLQNNVSYKVFTSNDEDFWIKLNGGFNVLTILNGEQLINSTSYNLANEDEFKGVFVQPSIAVENEFEINRSILLGIGYRFSKAINVTPKSDEKLGFLNHSIYFNFKYILY